MRFPDFHAGPGPGTFPVLSSQRGQESDAAAAAEVGSEVRADSLSGWEGKAEAVHQLQNSGRQKNVLVQVDNSFKYASTYTDFTNFSP